MSVKEVSDRYAKALYDIGKENSNQERIFNEIRAFQQIIEKSPEISEFVYSVIIKKEEKESALKAAILNKGFSAEMESFLGLLAKKARLNIFQDILNAYQQLIDKEHGVTRGFVKSSYTLDGSDRTIIEQRVAKAVGKKVILSYTVDPSVIGGLIAEVDGFRFDDTLTTHLRRLKEDINRSAH